MENQLMYAEIIDGFTVEMENDPKAQIISDSGIFLVTTKSNMHKYPELDFYEVCQEAIEAYDLKFLAGQ